MITGKRKKKLKRIFIVLACVLACALAILFAVLRERQLPDDIHNADGGHDHEHSDLDSMTPDGEQEGSEIKSYRIILPENAGAVLANEAGMLAQEISHATSLHTAVIYDREAVEESSECVEIILGRANRLAVADALTGLRNSDFVCVWSFGSIVLGGISEDSTLDAIDYFREKILPTSTRQTLMSEAQSYRSVGEYPLECSRINGYELYEYTIIYEDRENGAYKAVAEELRKIIRERSGYFLETLPRADFKGGRAITLSQYAYECEDKASIAFMVDSVMLRGDTAYSLRYACERFADALFENTLDGVSDFKINDGEERIFEINNPSIVISILDFIQGEALATDAFSDADKCIKGSGAHAVFASPLDKELYERLTFSSSYRAVNINMDHSRVFPLIYDSSRVTVSGERAINVENAVILYAEITVMSSGDRYSVFNAWCPDGVSADKVTQRIDQLIAQKGLGFMGVVYAGSQDLSPVISGGVILSDASSNVGALAFTSENLTVVADSSVDFGDEECFASGRVISLKKK